MAKLRIALTISGAVSLGAYEAGVLAGLLSAILPLCEGEDPTIRLDAIGGASAGSMAGLLAARCITAGYDPIYVMEQAWVVQDSIRKMKAHNSQSPLSMDDLRQLAAGLVDLKGHDAGHHQSVEVRMVMTLTCLRGLDYVIRGGGTGGQDIEAVTFLDLAQAVIAEETSAEDLLKDGAVVDVALASGANEVGFPPKLLDRSSVAQDYADRGLTLPPSKQPWYTDGGTIDNEPLGHTLDLTAAIDGAADDDDFRRLHLLVHPNPAAAPTGDGWADPSVPPTWAETLIRGDHLQRTQSLYDDLREVVKTNTRIDWMDQMVELLGPALDALPEEDARAVQAALRQTVNKVDGDQAALPGHQPVEKAPPASAPPEPTSTGEWLALALDKVTGTTGKRAVDVDVISPMILPGARETGVENLLAGDVLGHFGGFLDENMRRSDFHLGYASTLQWLGDGGLEKHGVDPADSETALQAAQKAFTPDPALWEKWGRTTAGKMVERHPVALAGMVAQIGRVLAHDAFHRHTQNPTP